MTKGLLAITRGGGKRFFKVSINSINDLDITDFPKDIKTLFGKDDVSRECDFNYKGKTITIFAFNNGVAGQENKFELPPPIDQTIYFGCIIVVCHVDNNIKTITPELFNDFYETVFEGFVSLEESETRSEEDEENTEDREFIVDDDYIEYEEGAKEDSEEEEEYITSDEDEGYICLESGTDESDEDIKSSDKKTEDGSTENDDRGAGAKIKFKIKISNSE